jgi:hypothetical protein
MIVLISLWSTGRIGYSKHMHRGKRGALEVVSGIAWERRTICVGKFTQVIHCMHSNCPFSINWYPWVPGYSLFP